jgi:hypothetical protein
LISFDRLTNFDHQYPIRHNPNGPPMVPRQQETP